MELFKTIAILLFVIVAWDLGWWAAGVEPVAPWTLKRQLRDGPAGSIRLIDVRTPSEFSWFHIPGSILQDGFSPPPDASAREGEAVVVCLSGHRSPIAALQMKKAGYAKVRYLAGGMLGWFLVGGAAEKGPAE